jgi:hypothetical protein
VTRVGAALLMLGLVAPAARAEPNAEPTPPSDDPPVCRAALEARPDAPALDALVQAEQEALRRAKARQREGKKLMRETLGGGRSARHRLPAFDAIAAKEADARAEGRALCFCRKRRGDPHRQDCEALYPVKIH